jgi:hypothetical protein
MTKLELSNITLVCATSDKIKETLKAIEICTNYANFDKIILFSDIDTEYTITIDKLNSTLEYNKFVYYELPKYIDTEFILSIQWDGFIINPLAWTDEFLQYDYIGAPWPWNQLCGNSGFCLKSQKFLESQKILSQQYDLENDDVHGHHGLHDDVMLCIKLRDQFTELGCKYATPEVGYKFSTEYGVYDEHKSFGFHDFRQQPQFRHLIYG